MPNIVTFWHGGPLHDIHRMCLASQVKLGYRVTLYCYEPVAGIPEGVGCEDAASILPRSYMERLRPRHRATASNRPILLVSDLIRFRLQRLGRGLWLDTDMYLVRPFEIDQAQPFFAWESRKFLGTAVLYLPPSHPINTDFEALLVSDDLMPDWLPWRLRLRQAWWRLLRTPHGPQDLSTLIYGPLALTALAARHRCLDAALPRASFYNFARTHGFFERSDFESVLSDPQVFGIHVQRKARWNQAPVPGSMYEWARRNVA